MERAYTEDLRESFFSLAEKDIAEIWQVLNPAEEAARPEAWRARYQEILTRYRLSSRFALMRLLFEKASGLSPANTDARALAQGFRVEGIGTFGEISLAHAQTMAPEEVRQYRDLLRLRVKESNPGCLSQAEPLIDAALALPAEGEKCALSRNDILRLGHMVDFSLEEMQFLLLRVLGDNEAGLAYAASRDLIDCYGFIVHAPLKEVEDLKAWYQEKAASIPKISYEDKPASFTQEIADSLEETFTAWPPAERADRFREWLLQQAPLLDIRSKSARRTYLNLAAYAYILTRKANTYMADLLTDNFYQDMENLSLLPAYHPYTESLFFRNGEPDADLCQEAASALIYENAEYAGGYHTHNRDSQTFYHVPHVEKGKLSVKGSLNRKSRQRVAALLRDDIAPTKSDLLFLLWFVANCHWPDIDDPSARLIFLDDFLAAASCLLESALLPDFYPPNLLEETILMSLVLGTSEQNPAMVYESICSALGQEPDKKKEPEARNDANAPDEEKAPDQETEPTEEIYRPASRAGMRFGAKRKTRELKREIAQWCLEHAADYPTKGECQKACAIKYGLGFSTVEGYCRALRDGKL